jgi:hypothetical protein
MKIAAKKHKEGLSHKETQKNTKRHKEDVRARSRGLIHQTSYPTGESPVTGLDKSSSYKKWGSGILCIACIA